MIAMIQVKICMIGGTAALANDCTGYSVARCCALTDFGLARQADA